ncbi:TPA: hypothetical protein N0F65_005669, partial [Lagenidium giganteum]
NDKNDVVSITSFILLRAKRNVCRKTAHFRFKVPIEEHESSTCNIPVESPLAKLIQRASIIVWDEAPMNKNFVFEVVDRTLQDVCNSTMSFGEEDSHFWW